MDLVVFLPKILAAVLAAWGFWLIAQGTKGRLGLDRGRCGRCGQVLSVDSSGAPPRVCPECGADLSQPANLRFARRVRSQASVMLGLALLLGAGVAWRGAGVVRAVTGGRFAAQPNPLDLLAGNETVDTCIAALERDPESAVGWLAVRSSVARHGWTSSELDRLRELIASRLPQDRFGPRKQIDRFIVDLDQPRWPSREARARMAAGWCGQPQLSMPARAEAGEVLEAVVRAGVQAAGPKFLAACSVEQVRIDGQEAAAPPDDPPQSSAPETADERFHGAMRRVRLRAPSATGDHVVEIDVVRAIFDVDDCAVGGLALADFATWPVPIAEERHTFRAPLAVVPPGGLLSVATVPSEQTASLRDAVRAGIAVQRAVLQDGAKPGEAVLTVTLTATPPPGLCVIATVAGRFDDEVAELGAVSAVTRPASEAASGRAGGAQRGGRVQRGGPWTAVLPAPPWPQQRFDLLLTPLLTDRAALLSDDLPVWNEPIVLENIPVEDLRAPR